MVSSRKATEGLVQQRFAKIGALVLNLKFIFTFEFST